MSKLNVSVSPHIHDKSSTSAIMRDVVIALLPALAASVAVFGYRAALVTAVCVASCVLSEWLFEKALKKMERIGMIFLTENGKSTERLLGIMTPWDILANQLLV